jgi:hypothetical protein
MLFVPRAQTSNRTPAAETRSEMQPVKAIYAAGTLQGLVKLGCARDAVDCVDRPYKIELFIQSERRGILPILVYADPRFSIRLVAGRYTISSADARSACCLPILKPITVVIRPRKIMQVDVRFESGLELPKR